MSGSNAPISRQPSTGTLDGGRIETTPSTSEQQSKRRKSLFQ